MSERGERKLLGQILKEIGACPRGADPGGARRCSGTRAGLLGADPGRTWSRDHQRAAGPGPGRQAGMEIVDLDGGDPPSAVHRAGRSPQTAQRVPRACRSELDERASDRRHRRSAEHRGPGGPGVHDRPRGPRRAGRPTRRSTPRIKRHYAGEAASLDSLIDSRWRPRPGARSTTESALARAAPVVQLLNYILYQAIRDTRQRHPPRALRGRVQDPLPRRRRRSTSCEAPPPHLAVALISRVKVMADLDIAETRVPAGRAHRAHGRRAPGRPARLDAADDVRRVLRAARARPQSWCSSTSTTLGLRPDDAKDRSRELIDLPHGIVLVTGPTGSGKTTTLYGVLNAGQRRGDQDHHHRGPGRVRPGRHRPGPGQRRDRRHLRRAACARSCARTRTRSWSARSATGRPPRSRSRPPSPGTWCSRPCTPTTRRRRSRAWSTSASSRS